MRDLVLLTAAISLSVSLYPVPAAGQGDLLEYEEVVLADFETDADVALWEVDGVKFTRTDEWASRGRFAGRILFPKWQEGGNPWPRVGVSPSKGDNGFLKDWSRFTRLKMDMYNPSSSTRNARILIIEGGRHFRNSRPLPPRKSVTLDIHVYDDIARYLRGVGIDSFIVGEEYPEDSYPLLIDNVRVVRDVGQTIAALRESILQFPGERAQPLRDALDALEEKAREQKASAGTIEEVLQKLAGIENQLITARSALPHRGDMNADPIVRLTDDRRPAGDERAAKLQVSRAAVQEQDDLRTRFPHDALAVGWTNSATWVMPYGKPFTGRFDAPEIAAARGEREGFQLVVLPVTQPLKNVDVEISPFAHVETGKPLGGQSYKAHFSPVGLGMRPVRCWLAAFMNRGRHPEGTASFQLDWFPDILYPWPKPVNIDVGRKQPYMIEFRVPRKAAAGRYKGQVTVTAEGLPAKTVDVSLRVYDFELPRERLLPTATNGAYADTDVALKYGLQITMIYQKMPLPPVEWWEDKVRKGMTVFNLLSINPHGKGVGRMWEHVTPDGKHVDQEFKNWLAEQLDSYVDQLREAGILDRAVIYGYDEVGADRYPIMGDVYAWLKDRYGIPGMVTVHSAPYGAPEQFTNADIWCIHDPYFDPVNAKRIKDSGRQVWWYWHGAGFSKSIDRWRRAGWQSWQWRVDGFLIYAASYWKRYRHLALDLGAGPFTSWHDPTKGPALLYFDSPEQGATRYPSLRIWNFRDGLEDYEYLHRLNELVTRVRKSGRAKAHADLLAEADEAIRVPIRIVDNWARRKYPSSDSDVRYMLAQRERIGEMIEELQQILDETSQ